MSETSLHIPAPAEPLHEASNTRQYCGFIVADLKLRSWLSVGPRGASAKLSCEARINQLDTYVAEHLRVSVGMLAVEVVKSVA